MTDLASAPQVLSVGPDPENPFILRVMLNRPQLRNAMNGEVIEGLIRAFEGAAVDPNVRCVVLTGAGKSFCAGADLNWMRAMSQGGHEANRVGARRLAGLFEAIDTCPKPVVGRIFGAAIGGGVGMVACCDVPIATADTKFAFSEVRLGLAPAVISPYVVRRIGEGVAREVFVTGARFTGERALAMGLVNHLVPAGDLDALDAKVSAIANDIVKGAPEALGICKSLAQTVAHMPREEALDYTSAIIARRRGSAEGQGGMRAFLTKQTPPWLSPASPENPVEIDDINEITP